MQNQRDREPQNLPDQPPEDVLNRISGVPKTPEEIEADRHRVEQERQQHGQMLAGNPDADTTEPAHVHKPQTQRRDEKA